MAKLNLSLTLTKVEAHSLLRLLENTMYLSATFDEKPPDLHATINNFVMSQNMNLSDLEEVQLQLKDLFD